LSDIIVVADTDHHRVLICGGFSGSEGNLPAKRVLPLLRACSCSIKDGDHVARSCEMPSHGVAHGAQSNESDALA
jgi:hypothetical protein